MLLEHKNTLNLSAIKLDDVSVSSIVNELALREKSKKVEHVIISIYSLKGLSRSSSRVLGEVFKTSVKKVISLEYALLLQHRVYGFFESMFFFKKCSNIKFDFFFYENVTF